MMFEHMPTDPPQEPPQDNGGDNEPEPEKFKFPLQLNLDLEFPDDLAEHEQARLDVMNDVLDALENARVPADKIDRIEIELRNIFDQHGENPTETTLDDVKEAIGEWVTFQE